MKNFTKFLTIAILGLAFNATILAQTNIANGTATAVILTPITITQSTPLNFGTIIPTAAPGTVEITTGGGRNISAVATLGAGFAAGVFDVVGSANLTFSIDIPALATNVRIYHTDGTNFMNVNGWTSNPTEALGGTLDGSGNATITVGAILQVGASQTAGTYSSTNPSGQTYSVTVNYN